MPRLQRAVPVLQVKDVARSIDWYVKLFGFEADPFPATPPFGFAILRRDDAEIMLQCSDAPPALKSTTLADAGWAVYLRTSGMISWSWPPPSGASPQCVGVLSGCATALWNSRSRIPMVTGSV